MATQQGATAESIAINAIKEAFADVTTSAEATVGATEPDTVVEQARVEPEPVAEKPLNKQEIKDAYAKIKLPDGASEEEIAAFKNDQLEFYGVLQRGGDNEDDLRKKLGEVQERVTAITKSVAERKQERAEIAKEFEGVEFDAIAAAPTAEKDPVLALGPEFQKLLDAADHNRVEELRAGLKKVKQQVTALRETIAQRAKAKIAIVQQLAKLPWAAIEAAPDDEKSPLRTLEEEAGRKLVEPLTKAGVEGALTIASDLERQVEALAQEMERRQAQKLEIQEAAGAVTIPPEAVPTLLDAAKAKVADELKKPLSVAVLEAATAALEELRAEADQVRKETDKLIARREMYRKQLDGAVQIAASGGVKGGDINAKVQAAKEILDAIPIAGLDTFPAALKLVRNAVHAAAMLMAQKGGGSTYIDKELTAIKKEIEGLPAGKEKQGLVVEAAEIDKSMSQKKITKNKVQTNLKAVRGLRVNLDKAKLAIGAAMEEMAGQREFIRSEIGIADPDGVHESFATKLQSQREAVEALMTDPLTPTKLSQADSGMKAFKALHARAAQDALDDAAVAKQLAEIPALYGTIQPAARKPVQAELAASWKAGQALAAADGDNRDMKKALTALQKLRARLAEVDTENKKAAASKGELKLAKASGVTVSEADAEEIYDAFGPDAIDALKAGLGNMDAFAGLCKTIRDGKPGGVAALGTLTREGLGSAEALVAVFKNGCGGDATKLQQFETAFGSEEDRTNLRGMLDTALGKDAALLTGALQTGCGLDTIPVSKRKDFPTASADLKKFCAAFKDEQDQKKLGNLLKSGGIGAHPKIFGNLLKIGCEGDPKKGEDSMDHRAAQMKKLAAAYTKPEDQARLKGMIDYGGFGHQNCPQVLAHVLKTGCDGDPAKLKNLGNAFKTPEDLGKLNTLIMSGGFGGQPPDDRQDTLGKVLGKGLRYADTPDKDEPQRLKNLHAAFAGNGGADMAKLKTIVDTFNGDLEPVYTTPPPRVAAREEPQPGEKFFNLLNKKNMNGNLTKLKDLHDQLNAQFGLRGQTVGINPPSPVPRNTMGHEDMLRNSSTIKKAPLSGAQPGKLGKGNCANITSARMSHFCRHSREHTDFELASRTLVTNNLNSPVQTTRDLGKRKAKKTTLWPEGITDKQIAEFVDVALTHLGGNAPKLTTLADGNFVQFDNQAIPSNPAFVITIGFERTGGQIEITQFFPTGGPGLETIDFYDAHAIKEGIV